MRRRSLLAIIATLGIVRAGLTPLAAQTYPVRPIKVIVPFPPGGPTDVLARLLADKLTAALGQPVVIDNRPGGAGGTVGVKAAAAAEPDGYTLLLSNVGTLTITPAIYKTLDADPLKSLTAIVLVATSPQVLVVHPSVPAASLPELVAYAKSNPGKISYASPGHGTQPHLLGEMFKSIAGADVVHVPYRGSAPAITDVLAGQVQMYFETTTVMLAHIQAGKVRALAVAGGARAPQLPSVPTTLEGGYAKLQATLWSGLMAPAGTPGPVVERLNAAVNEVLGSADMKASLAKLGADPKGGSVQFFTQFFAAEVRKWAGVVSELGIKSE
jgi:tripartite-type tricarboxylate transporter receptor subunit TctC